MPATNKIVLGTVQFGLEYGISNVYGKPNERSVKSILDFAFANNIRLLDTAEAYGNSQEVIGNYHKVSKNKFKIITKFSAGRNDLPENLQERIRHDIKVLNIDSLYCYMFHSFKDFKRYFDLFKNDIRELKDTGIINKFGVSVYANNEIEELLQYDGIDLIQLPFNLLDNNNQRAAVIEKVKERGIEVHTRSTFLQGLFFKNGDQLTGKLTVLKPYLAEIERIAGSYKISVGDLSMHYVFQQRNIDNILIGVDTVEQLVGNLNVLKTRISPEAIKEIDLIDVKEPDMLNPSNWNR